MESYKYNNPEDEDLLSRPLVELSLDELRLIRDVINKKTQNKNLKDYTSDLEIVNGLITKKERSLRIPDAELANLNTSPVTREEMDAAVNAVNNSFVYEAASRDSNGIEVGAEIRPNIENLLFKRDEYIRNAIKKFPRRINEKSFILFINYVKLIKKMIFEDHGVDVDLLQTDNSYREKNKTKLSELENTYPSDRIEELLSEYWEIPVRL